jgi:hypothetical protein
MQPLKNISLLEFYQFNKQKSLDYNPLNEGENGHKKEPVVVNLDEISADELNLAMEREPG